MKAVKNYDKFTFLFGSPIDLAPNRLLSEKSNVKIATPVNLLIKSPLYQRYYAEACGEAHPEM